MDVKTLKSGDIVAKELVLVAEASLLKDKRGQDYYNLRLNCEGAESIQAKVWSTNIGEPIQRGDLLEVYGRVDDRFGLQIDVQQYVHQDSKGVDLSLYYRTAPIDVEAGFEKIFNWGDGRCPEEDLRGLMGYLHDNERFALEFKRSPAAMVHHHNYQGGLVEHTLEVYELAEAMCEHYDKRVDRHMLLAAAALHDIGKIKSYELLAGTSQKTEVGNLLDHVFISASMISNLWDTLSQRQEEEDKPAWDATRKNLLIHAVLAHHGRSEWGAPVLPQTPEALLVFICDNTSAMMKNCFEAIDGRRPEDSWTDWVYLMDARRKFFVPPKPQP